MGAAAVHGVTVVGVPVVVTGGPRQAIHEDVPEVVERPGDYNVVVKRAHSADHVHGKPHTCTPQLVMMMMVTMMMTMIITI